MKTIGIIMSMFLLLTCMSCQQESAQPDEQFLKIHFRYGFRNELNTFDQTYTKDLVADGKTTVSFWLTTAEQNQIIEKLEAAGFINLPETITQQMSDDSTAVFISPDPGTQFMTVKYADVDKAVSWYFPLPEDDETATTILEINQFIIDLIEAKPEYQQLPEPNGGYI